MQSLRKVIENKISTLLNFPIQKSIDLMNQKVKYIPFQNGLFAKGKINTLNIPFIKVQSDSLIICLSVKVNLQIGLEQILK